MSQTLPAAWVLPQFMGRTVQYGDRLSAKHASLAVGAGAVTRVRRSYGALVGAALCVLVSGCGDALLPSLTGEAPSGADTGGLVLGTGSFVPGGVTPGASTGTVVGERIDDMRTQLELIQDQVGAENGALQQLRVSNMRNAAQYHTRVAEIGARLQTGTTPGNPELVARWNEAQQNLDQFDQELSSLNLLATEVANTSAGAAYLLATARATYGLTGAVDADHVQLAVLEDETNQTVVLIDRLLTELTEDLGRQTSYLSRERDNLRVLSLGILNGEWFGRSLANAAYNAGPIGSAPPVGVAANRPLMIIRFDANNVDYDQALYTAASNVIDVRPNAQFELVAVAPAQGLPAQQALSASSARQNAENVRLRLTQFGIPPQRVALTEASSSAAFTNEVHIYVR